MKQIEFEYSRRRLFSGFDGKYCKTIPALATDGQGTVLLSYQMLLLTGSDVFFGQYLAKSTDGGETFEEPQLQEKIRERWEGNIRIAPTSIFPVYNKKHGKWFGLGCTIYYENDREPILKNGLGFGAPIFVKMDEKKGSYESFEVMPFPLPYHSAAMMASIVEEENGDMLIPFHYTPEGDIRGHCVVVRYALEENNLRVVDWGNSLARNDLNRGLAEPSVARLHDRYYMTIRADELGLYAVSEDGLHYSEPKPWMWDDGTILENYNTQQHWISHPDGLFLAYTRKGAHNDHVFRHRAPIFMARFDEERECLIRETEVILVPELGARLGNFMTLQVSPEESWLITAEWMQPKGCEKYGSDNSLWWTKIFWKDRGEKG